MLRKAFVAIAVVVAGLAGFFGGMAVSSSNPTDSSEYKQLASDLKDTEGDLAEARAQLDALTSDPQGVADEDAAALSGDAAIAPRNIKISLRTRSKECFGSAGCNVTVQINPDYVGNQDVSSGSWDITYEIRGGDDGPQIETMTLEDGTFSFPEEQSLQTSSSGMKLKAVVTSVHSSE